MNGSSVGIVGVRRTSDEIFESSKAAHAMTLLHFYPFFCVCKPGDEVGVGELYWDREEAIRVAFCYGSGTILALKSRFNGWWRKAAVVGREPVEGRMVLDVLLVGQTLI